MEYTWEQERELVRLTLNAVIKYDPNSSVHQSVFEGQQFQEAFPNRTSLGLSTKFNRSLALKAVTETELLDDFRLLKEGVDGNYSYEYMPDENREIDLEKHDEAEHEEPQQQELQQQEPQQAEPMRVTPTLRTFFSILARIVARLGNDNDELAVLSNKIAAIDVSGPEEEDVTKQVKEFLTRGLQL